MNKKIAIVGAGGHGKVVGEIALLNHFDDINFFDDKKNEIEGFPFIISGNLNDLSDHLNEYDAFFVAVGENKLRSTITEWLKKKKTCIVTLVHPRATISQFCSIGIGICIMANAVVNSGAQVKDGVIINTSASVDHDCLIEDFAHISPNCSLSGSVKIGKFSHLGSGTSVHPGIKIGKNVKTAVGSKIFKDVLDNTVYKN